MSLPRPPILGQPAVLRAHAGPDVLLGFDFDGTLAPIVDDPERAQMRDSTRERLRRLAQQQPCIVISGRGRADVLQRVQGIALREVIGNHGLEAAPDGAQPLASRVSAWRERLQPLQAEFPGLRIEDKRFSLTVHYRDCASRPHAADALRRAVTGLTGVRAVEGLYGLNLLPDVTVHKGTALLDAHRRLGTQRIVFIGDEETDEDVFRLTDPALSLTVRVGPATQSRAHYSLRDQTEIESFLDGLLRPDPV